MQTRVLILLIFAAIVAVFAVFNIQTVEINYLIGKAEIQLIFVIIFTITVGALFMYILSSFKQLKQMRRIKALEKENTKLKEELEQQKKLATESSQDVHDASNNTNTSIDEEKEAAKGNEGL